MKSKKGLELSINFIVMLILAIVVFGFGIKLAFQMMGTATDVQGKLSEDMENRLKEALSSNSRVSMVEGIIKMKPGETQIVGIGIYNVLENAQTFIVKVTPYKVITNEENEDDFVPDEGAKWIMQPDQMQIKQGEKQVIPFPIKPPGGTIKGTYIFNVEVCTDSMCSGADSHYGETHQVMVNVN